MWVLTRKAVCCRGGEWRGPGDLEHVEHATGRRVEQREENGKERPQGKRQEEDGISDFHCCLKLIRIQKFVRFEFGIYFMKNPYMHLFKR